MRTQAGLVARSQVIVATQLEREPAPPPDGLEQWWITAAAPPPAIIETADALIARRVRASRWDRVAPGVYGDRTHAPSFDRRAWRAVLAAGPRVAVAQGAAAHLLAVHAFASQSIIVALPHGHHPRLPGFTIRQTKAFLDHHVTKVRGIPVTNGARTVVDLAGVVASSRVGALLDEAVVAKVTTLPTVSRALADVAVRGRRGVGRLGRALDERGPGYIPPASELERVLHELVELAGLAPASRQHPFPGREPGAGRIDAAYPTLRLAIEVDGRRWHTRIADLQRDHARDREAARQGWVTIRLLWEDVTFDPLGAATELAAIHAARAQLVRASAA